jgi:hypothetical protein
LFSVLRGGNGNQQRRTKEVGKIRVVGREKTQENEKDPSSRKKGRAKGMKIISA